jgi:hypothetical protein
MSSLLVSSGCAPNQGSVDRIAAILAEHPDARRDHLIPILQAVQDAEGYLSREAIVRIGLLGDTLHAHGLKTAAVGNSDDRSLHREIAAICMDSRGLIDFGNVSSNINTPDNNTEPGLTLS